MHSFVWNAAITVKQLGVLKICTRETFKTIEA